MATTAHIDRVDDLSCSERLGTIVSLTRKARVTIDSPPPNFNVLKTALAACPAYLTPPDSITDPTGVRKASVTDPNEPFGALVLTGRDPRVVEGEPSCVDVILHYEHILSGNAQKIIDPDSGFLFGRGKTSIVDKTTNFYHPFGDTSLPREVIQAAHTFPTNDNGIAGLPLDPLIPRTVMQGGEVNIPFPQSNFSLSGYWTGLRNPVEKSFEVVARINDGAWLGRPALTWICSEMSWEIVEPSKHHYKVGFEFQYNVDTWDATVLFIDQRTGKPPADVRKATTPDPNGVTRLVAHPDVPLLLVPAGMWQVPSLARIDFNRFFGAMFNGTAMAILE